MTDTPERSPGGPANGDRLNGWKDISGYLGKSVRTAQRWEQELRLPVRRIHTAAGEIVYASRRELDEWLQHVGEGRSSESVTEVGNGSVATPPTAAPSLHDRGSRRGRRWIAAAAMLVTVGVVVVLMLFNARPLPRSQSDGVGSDGRPASWKAEGHRLVVFDEQDQKLWEYRFDFPLKEDAYGPLGDAGRATVIVADLEGDGRREVLVRTVPAFVVSEASVAARQRVICLNSDGSKRFDHQAPEAVQFGNDPYGPPFGVNRILTTDNSDGRKSIWLTAQHSQMFPTVLQKLDVNGRLEGSYWSNGHLTVAAEAQVGGRRAIAVGGTDNGLLGGSLAFVDYDHPTGSAPAADGPYRCTSCEVGTPLGYFVFPQLDTARASGLDRPFVTELRGEPGGRLRVTVTQGTAIARGFTQPSLVFYTLGPDLRVLGAEVGDNFRQVHAQLQLAGLLNHPVGPEDEAALFPILSWDGHRFVKIDGPQAPRSGAAY